MSNAYDDIKNVVYPRPTTHPRMSMHDRAAQFSPFSALVGYDAIIDEISLRNADFL